MLKVLLGRLQQGYHTMRYPDGPAPALPDRFLGLPKLDAGASDAAYKASAGRCPTGALQAEPSPKLDLGKCLFCGQCAGLSTQNQDSSRPVVFTNDYRLAVRQRRDLVIQPDKSELNLEAQMTGELKKLFGRSLKLRQVSAGGCNACEADTNVLNTLAWDLSRFGIQFVASPRHADGLLITGPVTANMELALKKTYEAVPKPKIVIAVGACAISGGPYLDHSQVRNGADAIVPVDLYIPGCPPHPLTILEGLLRFIGRI